MNTTRSAAALMQAFEVDGGAALLVHDADLDRVLRQAEHVLDAAEQLDGERHLVGAVHLRLDDVDRAGAAVAQRPLPSPAFRPCMRDQAGEQRVQDALGHLVAVGVETIASLVIRWPTLRTNSRLRPGSVSSPPSGAV